MTKYFSIIIIIFFSTSAFSQKLIDFHIEKSFVENRKFYVTKIIDLRENKKSIGEFKGFYGNEIINIENGVLKATGDYFQRSFTKKTNEQIPVIIKIKVINVKQKTIENKQTGIAYISLLFEKENNDTLEINSEIIEITENVFASHDQRIKAAFKDCAIKFNNTIEDPNVYNVISEENEEAIEITFDSEDNDTPKKEYDNNSKSHPKKVLENVTTVGYAIGGYNLIGIDYERRISKHVGIHGGVGILGYTVGTKIHLNEKQNSLFLNLSWKDSGLGYINGFGIEAGSRWIWSKKRNFGLLYQGGILIYNHIDDDFVQDYYDGEAPILSIFFGVGLSW